MQSTHNEKSRSRGMGPLEILIGVSIVSLMTATGAPVVHQAHQKAKARLILSELKDLNQAWNDLDLANKGGHLTLEDALKVHLQDRHDLYTRVDNGVNEVLDPTGRPYRFGVSPQTTYAVNSETVKDLLPVVPVEYWGNYFTP